MYNCENCNGETGNITEVDAKNYPNRFKLEKNNKICVCKRCLDDFNERNDYLKRIIEFDGKNCDRKVILAGPGTGKTYVFQEYIRNKFCKDDPVYIATFINNLVDDLRKDFEKRLKDWNIKINTFHRFCYRLLKLLGKDYFYCADLTDLIIEDANIIDNRLINKKILTKDLNYYKITSDIKYYFERGFYYNAVGNDNICFELLKTLKERDGIDLSKNYKQIIIDEYQDFNFTESSIIRIISKNNKILIAGDDDQALYTFKDSNPDYIRKLWENPEFSQFNLPFCYRCTDVVINSFKYFLDKVQKEEGLLKERKPKSYKCYFPDKYKDSQKYDKIFWHKTSIRKGNFSPIQKILIDNIKNYIKAREIEDGKLNFLVIYPRNRKSMCEKIKNNIIKELKESKILIADQKKKTDNDSLLIKNGYRLLKDYFKSNLGWRIIIKNDPFDGWKELIKKSKDKNIFELLPIEYKDRHLGIVEKIEDQKNVEEEKKEEGINLLFTNFLGAKGLSADHVFVLFVQDKIFPDNASKITEDEVYKFLVAMTRAKKSLNFITIHPHSSKFIDMLPQANIK